MAHSLAQTSIRRLAQPCEAAVRGWLKVPANEPVRSSSSPRVIVFDSACHAGGRGFESRRSRTNPCKPACHVVRMDARSAPTTHNFLDATTKRPKTARYAVARRRFKPIQGRVPSYREGGVRLHRMTGGHGKRERGKGQMISQSSLDADEIVHGIAR